MPEEFREDVTHTAAAAGEAAGAIIGDYRLIELIGEGGMGEVWLAEQFQPFRRRVALKLIKIGMDTREVVARFASERQALALMDHAAIAKVFDAGSTPLGRPYFVMEYVPGVPITTYCDKEKLNTRDRLKLLIRVCEGVQHAHQKAIIHRDLKPSNILVSTGHGEPIPKIIDFGVAKAISHRLTGDTMFTMVGALIGTPEYTSPEQAQSGGEDIDTRTDVYSLGVVMYQLLVGTLPFDYRKQAFHETLRRLQEEDAPKPSTKLRALREHSTIIANQRATELKTLARELRGDLDSIALKALEKNRNRRYGSPSELADDLRRYLRNEPVAATAPTLGYRARKYIARNRLGVTLVTALLTVLIVFAVSQSLQLKRTTRERDRADRIAKFMTDMFNVSDPSEAHGQKVTAREILDNASVAIGTGLAKDPDLHARMVQLMATVYYNLGLYARAERLFSEALDLQKRELGARNRETLRSLQGLANSVMFQTRYADAERLEREALRSKQDALGKDDPDTLEAMTRLAMLLDMQGRYQESEKLQRETLDVKRRVLGPDHPDTLRSMNALGVVIFLQGRSAEAERLYRETLEARRRVLGYAHPDTLTTSMNLASALETQSRFPESEKLQREVLEISRSVLGPDHVSTLKSMGNLAVVLEDEGRYQEAEKLQREVLEKIEHNYGPDHLETMKSLNVLAGILSDEQRHSEAQLMRRQAVETARRILGPEHPTTRVFLISLVGDLTRAGDYAAAEKLCQELYEMQRRVLGPDHHETALSLYNLACIAARRGKRDSALTLLRESIDHGLAHDVIADMRNDSDLASLRKDSRFTSLIADARPHLNEVNGR